MVTLVPTLDSVEGLIWLLLICLNVTGFWMYTPTSGESLSESRLVFLFLCLLDSLTQLGMCMCMCVCG